METAAADDCHFEGAPRESCPSRSTMARPRNLLSAPRNLSCAPSGAVAIDAMARLPHPASPGPTLDFSALQSLE
jgi:hypothetical protein